MSKIFNYKNISGVAAAFNKFLVLILFFLYVFTSHQASAQNSKLSFEHFGIEQGILPNVPCAFQDRKGYLWVGSTHGVFRYDGYVFKPYIDFMENTSKVSDAPVNAICDDSGGNIWIGHVQGLDRLTPETGEVKRFILNPKLPITDWSNHVLSLLEDSRNNLWVGTGNGLYLFNEKNETFYRITHDSTDGNSIIHNAINSIYEDRSGNLWFGTGGGLEKLESPGKFKHYWTDLHKSSAWDGSSHWILKIFEGQDNILWLGTSGGLVEFNKKNNSFSLYKNIPNDPSSLKNNVVSSICEDLEGNLWLNASGLNIFNKKTKKFSYYPNIEADRRSISSNEISSIIADKTGIIWISTYGGGLNKYVQPNPTVKKYIIESVEILGNHGGSIVSDNNGKIWIGMMKGLFSFDPDKEIFKNEGFKNNIISTVFIDKEGTLWIYNYSNGYLYFKKNNSERINQFFLSENKPFNEWASCLVNGDNNVWVSTGDGKLLRLNLKEKTIIQIAKFDNSIYTLYEDNDGLLWIGTSDAGVMCYNPLQKTFTNYISVPGDSSTLKTNHIAEFCEDGRGTLWAVTSSFLNYFDKHKQKFIRIGGKDGFPKDAYSLISDDHGNLWISSESGVVKYNPFTKQFNKYNDVKLSVGYRMNNGELYFLSTTLFQEKQSLIRINPDNISNNNFEPPIVVTSFRIFEKPYPIGNEIHLRFDENYIAFEFAALSYISPQRNQYAYKLEGVDKDWVYSGTRRFASYPNLDPGEYIFRVKGSNNDGVWNEEGTSIAIIISPPWWQTWWAYSSYALLFGFALFGIRRYELNRVRLKNKIKMDEAILKEKEETEKIKSRFFANISHEFRTPLTLILGPAEKIFSNTSDNHIKDADIIRRNSRRLLQLINQLLDLSKLEAGKLKLEASKGNIVSFVKGAALSFESLAESKDINLKINSEKEFIEMYFDKEKMMKILTNILSNAFKFTPKEGTITVSLTFAPSPKGRKMSDLSAGTIVKTEGQSEDILEIKIKDTGIGIAQEEIPKLFDRFYQVDSSHTREYEGTGIGLALTKELVELHHGSISVESEKGVYTQFVLKFPLGKNHFKDEEIVEEKEIKESVIQNPDEIGMKNLSKGTTDAILSATAPSHFDLPARQAGKISVTNESQIINGETLDKTIILVVEDNYDMRQYIRESLNGNYLIEEAVNGEQGVRKAEKIIPDLIISDMMMPKMDGNQLVKILKNDEKTSHIPIILLTAKAGQENKLEGLEIGADDYLTKPFDIKELQVRIKNLISIRKKLQEKFSKIGTQIPQPPKQKLSSIDEKFMLRVGEVIEKHISEEEFDIEEFCKEVAMSRTQLHRKLKALTGKSASLYVRSVKMMKAKKMIEEQTGNISEIAYSLGFSSPAYFTRCFKEEFGYPPSEVKNK